MRVRTNLHLPGIGICRVAVLVLLSFKIDAASFDYLYIEASEGNSSGGHAAIQFGHDVYHFQHIDPGLIRLYKREKDDFHFLYRFLQNRPIHVSRINVSDETYQLLKNHFKRQYLLQKRLFDLLDDVEKDRHFIRRLLSRMSDDQNGSVADSFLQLQGVGLFYPDHSRLRSVDSYQAGTQPEPPSEDAALFRSPRYRELKKHQAQVVKRLRKKIEHVYGSDFLTQRRQTTESRIKELKPNRWPVVNPTKAGETLPPSSYSFTEAYSDYLTALFAIKVINDEKPIQPDAFFVIDQHPIKISEAERLLLLNIRKHLAASFFKSLTTDRPDWGYAMLINLSRYLAVDASLYFGYWVFIDDFTNDSERLTPAQYGDFSDQIQVLIGDAQNVFDTFRQSATKNQYLDETGYSHLELLANRYSELMKSKEQHAIRYNGEKALPTKSIGFPDSPVPNLTQQQLTTALSEVDRYQADLVDQLKKAYRYHLIYRNCVTELFRNIHEALFTPYDSDNTLSNSKTKSLTKLASKKRLGGYISDAYRFIPFISYQGVAKSYNVSQSLTLDSYRGLELTKLKAQQNELLVALRESNTVSSSLYRYNPDDALFIFFTDDNIMLRPIFGAFNTVAGIGQFVYGLLNWPLDSGKNLKSGTTGVLMSLPELVFFNMRKGSYRFLSFNEFAQSNLK